MDVEAGRDAQQHALDIAREWIAVLDYGSQTTQLIARRIREARVYCEILAHTNEAALTRPGLKGIVLSGGPASITEPGAPDLPPGILDRKLPILGICYGLQILARALGGKVVPAIGGKREYGPARLHVDESGFLGAREESLDVWMNHGDHVESAPPGARVLASTQGCPVAAFDWKERGIFAIQFHPEVSHTPRGGEILNRFLFEICECKPAWEMGSFVHDTIHAIRERVGDREAICAVSGGVDSSVAAALVGTAIGSRLHPIFVDHGLHRNLTEVRSILEILERKTGVHVTWIDASGRFLDRLKGVDDPEEKRKRIGETFIRVFEEEARRLGGVSILVQGTLYPDVIESSVGHHSAARIKTHHNVGGLPEKMHLEVLEPLRDLFKDEVRKVGEELGLPKDVVQRQPFPGPGLAVRVLGFVTPERVETLRRADGIFRSLLREWNLERETWQAFPVLLPVKSVGVMGDFRTYEETICLRAVTSQDGMTADWAKLPHPFLAECSRRIINEVPGVNRVVYDITSKPPGTIEWE
jgi:GMP synthase (glutamine-hydrolysing)